MSLFTKRWVPTDLQWNPAASWKSGTCPSAPSLPSAWPWLICHLNGTPPWLLLPWGASSRPESRAQHPSESPEWCWSSAFWDLGTIPFVTQGLLLFRLLWAGSKHVTTKASDTLQFAVNSLGSFHLHLYIFGYFVMSRWMRIYIYIFYFFNFSHYLSH